MWPAAATCTVWFCTHCKHMLLVVQRHTRCCCMSNLMVLHSHSSILGSWGARYSRHLHSSQSSVQQHVVCRNSNFVGVGSVLCSTWGTVSFCIGMFVVAQQAAASDQACGYQHKVLRWCCVSCVVDTLFTALALRYVAIAGESGKHTVFSTAGWPVGMASTPSHSMHKTFLPC